ncbi:MAG TPA: hypothetical protein VFN30_07740 [Chitinophagaceae bacterium]|nr:hypothetical protein [Chitinophagaceae bacterium]
MANTIAIYYTDELDEWERLISFNDNEVAELENKLVEVIQRNTIPDISLKVESQQNKLAKVATKFNTVKELISQQHVLLKKDDVLVEDALINQEIEERQTELRHHIQVIEKEYIDAKYTCHEFLLGTLKKYH